VTPDGFIANPRQRQPGCLIKPGRLVEMAEKKATSGCGLYFELFHFEVLSQLCSWRDMLSDAEDKEALMVAAKDRGYSIDERTLLEASEDREELLAELHEEMR